MSQNCLFKMLVRGNVFSIIDEHSKKQNKTKHKQKQKQKTKSITDFFKIKVQTKPGNEIKCTKRI